MEIILTGGDCLGWLRASVKRPKLCLGRRQRLATAVAGFGGGQSAGGTGCTSERDVAVAAAELKLCDRT